VRSPSKFYNLPLKAGDVLVIYTGGGGYGRPDQRDGKASAGSRVGYVTSTGAYEKDADSSGMS